MKLLEAQKLSTDASAGIESAESFGNADKWKRLFMFCWLPSSLVMTGNFACLQNNDTSELLTYAYLCCSQIMCSFVAINDQSTVHSKLLVKTRACNFVFSATKSSIIWTYHGHCN
jgi:hypothetical protein